MISRPNILWLMTDEQRCDSLGCYRSPWARTPRLDALADEGVVFESAITPAPACLPARTSIMTGRYPSSTGIWHNSNEMQAPMPNLMRTFRDAGYRSATFGKQHYVGNGSAFDLEEGPWISSHVHYFNYAPQYDESAHDVIKYPGNGKNNWIFGGRYPAPADQTAEAQAIANAMRWLEAGKPDSPFFLRISFNAPHTPVSTPAPFDQLIPEDAIRFPAQVEAQPAGVPTWLSQSLAGYARSSVLSAQQIRKMRQYYYGLAAYLDTLFAKLLDWMADRDLLSNTIIVFCSDHGTHLGDYGLVQKQTFFDPVVNVPFFFWAPGRIRSSGRFRTPVGIHSLLPTLIELAGLESPETDVAPSLAQALRNGNEPREEPVFSEFTLQSSWPNIQHDGRLVMVRRGDWKLSACMDPDIHDLALYRLRDDPCELVNRADDPAHAGRRDQLLELICDHLGTSRQNRGF